MPNFPRTALRPAAAQRIAAIIVEVFMCRTSCKGERVSITEQFRIVPELSRLRGYHTLTIQRIASAQNHYYHMMH